MHIKLLKYQAVNPDELVALEREIGCSLPMGYRDFAAKYNGAKPENNSFEYGEDGGASVEGFIPIAETLKELKYFHSPGSSRLPVAWASCGNYVCIDLVSGEVLFWDHEFDEYSRIASSFEKFLDVLKPFDISDIHYDPGQIKSVWVHPDFRKPQE